MTSGWVGQLALQSKGHASSLYLLAYYMGSSVLGSAGGVLAAGTLAGAGGVFVGAAGGGNGPGAAPAAAGADIIAPLS